MRSAAVVEAGIAADPGAGFRNAGVGPQADLLVFDAPPKPLDKDVVAPGALAIHADLDLPACQHLDEVVEVNWLPCSVLYISDVPAPGVCQISCPPISCGVFDFRGADSVFRD